MDELNALRAAMLELKAEVLYRMFLPRVNALDIYGLEAAHG